MSIEKVKDNIRAMLNLANDKAATDGEIKNALKFAQKLMDEHNLQECDLDIAEEKLESLYDAKFDQMKVYYTDTSRTVHWLERLAQYCCQLMGGVKCYVGKDFDNPECRSHRGMSKFVTFYGIQEEVELTVEIFNDLKSLISHFAVKYYGATKRGSGREYCQGFVDGLFIQFQENQPKISHTQTEHKNALVVKRNELIKKKQELSKIWLEEECGISLSKRRAVSLGRSDQSARSHGKVDGQNHSTQKGKTLRLK